MDSNTRVLQAMNGDAELRDCRPSLLHENQSVGDEMKETQFTVEVGSETATEMDSESSLEAADDIRRETNRISRSLALWRRFQVPSCYGLFSYASPSIVRTRVYQVWPGNNVFFFRGRIMFGPDPRGFILTATSILLSNWIFCVYIGDNLRDQFIFIIPISMILTVIVMVNLILVGTRDPGIIPRNEKASLEENITSIRMRSMRVMVDGVEMKLKYCKICKIFRPPRTCHCAVCDNCVEKFDHHCPWIGQCIGLRNYRYYMMFILSALVFFAYIFSFSSWRIKRKVSETGSGMFGALISVPETFVLELFSFFAILFLGGLSSYHAYLIALNQTARENFKRRYATSPNPYDKGLILNIKDALLARLPPSKINFRADVEPNYNFIARMLINSKGEKQEETQEKLVNTYEMHEEERHEAFEKQGDGRTGEELTKKSYEVELVKDVKIEIK